MGAGQVSGKSPTVGGEGAIFEFRSAWVSKSSKMSMPEIHNCAHLSSENERIRRKYKKLSKRNAVLEKELCRLKDQFRIDRCLKDQVSRRSVHIQTDHRKGTSTYKGHPPPPERPRKIIDEQVQRTNKMITMHSSLMKRYEKELKSNTTHVEKMAVLTLKNQELEQKIKDLEQKLQELGRENEALQLRLNTISVKERLTPSKRDLLADLAKVSKERDRLLNERRQFKDELKMLDRGFFEEIEDLKYALQQSARLNTAYEKALHKLCKQFGVPLPNVPGAATPRQRKRREQDREFK